MDSRIQALLAGAAEPDEISAAAVRERAAQVLRPTGALARLDAIAEWLARWQRTIRPAVRLPAVAIFVADHGVADEGVSAYPQEVTRSVLEALKEGAATACVLARAVGASLEIVDVGVGNPTANLVFEPALSGRRFDECFDIGRQTVKDIEADLLVFGEMGIGNTTSAAAVAATLFGSPVEDWIGLGTGIDQETLSRKITVVEKARARVGETSPLEVLREVGGAELVAIAGAVVEARLRSIPVVLDGFVVTAAVTPLELTKTGALDHCVAGHSSSEPGHRLLLEKLGKRPLLDLDLRLGEGSGAIAAVPLIKMAAAAVTEVATFAEWAGPS